MCSCCFYNAIAFKKLHSITIQKTVCMSQVPRNTFRNKTSEKIFTFYIENAKLRCCCGAVDSSALQN